MAEAIPVVVLRVLAQPLRRLDLLLLLLLAALAAIGWVALQSAAGPALLERQETYLLLGLLLLLACACVPWRWWQVLAPAFYLLCLLLLALVPWVGIEVNNARRWLDLGFIRLQPSELAKVAVPLALAAFYGLWPQRRYWQHGAAFLLTLLPAWMILRQPDLGTAVMVLLAGLLVIFFAGLPWLFIVSGLALAAMAAPFMWRYLLADYQKERILAVIDPYSDPLGAGYHTIQSSIAVGSGGYWGKGWSQGSQSQLGFLPEHHTDFIFAVYAEEFGFVGCLILLGVMMLVFLRLLMIAGKARVGTGNCLVAAFAFAFVLQGLINLAMVSGLLPVVGLPLPLVSYGGTSLLAFALAFGIAMSVSKHRPRLGHGGWVHATPG